MRPLHLNPHLHPRHLPTIHLHLLSFIKRNTIQLGRSPERSSISLLVVVDKKEVWRAVPFDDAVIGVLSHTAGAFGGVGLFNVRERGDEYLFAEEGDGGVEVVVG